MNSLSKFRVVWSKRLILFLVFAAVMVGLDQLVKWLVQANVGLGDANRITVIENFFYINKSYNTAVAFSIGSTWGVGGRVLNISISVVMSVVIFFYWLTHDHKMKVPERIIALLLGAGAVGNLIDRAFYWEAITGFDGVIDMFQFYLGGGPSKSVNFFNPFATFNVADAYLTIGIFALLILLVVDMIRAEKVESQAPAYVASDSKPEEIKKPSEEPTSPTKEEGPSSKEGE